MQLDTAVEEVRARLQELSADFWTAAEVLRAIHEGVNRFAQEEKWRYLYTVFDAGTVLAGNSEVPLTSGIAFERHFDLLLTLDGDPRPRSPRRISPYEGYELRQRYYTDSQEPIAYYMASQANPSGGQYQATIFLVPSLTRDADIEYQYIRDPVVPTGTNHLDLPEEYSMAAIAYATGHLFLKELSTSQKAGEQFDLYRKIVDDARRQHRRISPDEGFAMGRNEPEWGRNVIGEVEYTELVTPALLGP